MKIFLLAVVVLAVFAVIPSLNAKAADDQIQTAGAIALTTELLDKMDNAAKAVRADEAARTELSAVKETDPDPWAAAVDSKCPKTAAHLKEAGITADQLMKGALAIMACFMDEAGDLAKSDNATVKANVEFVKANKDRADKVGGEVMAMGTPPETSSDSKKP